MKRQTETAGTAHLHRMLDASRALGGERLGELVASIADAPDFSTAARFLVAQLLDETAAGRASIYMLSRDHRSISIVATEGETEAMLPDHLNLKHATDPIVISTMTLTPVKSLSRPMVALPFPQPQSWHVPRVSPPSMLERLSADEIEILGPVAGTHVHVGYSPCGVIILEHMECGDDLLLSLNYAMRLLGPVLWRIMIKEDFDLSSDRMDEQSELLTSLINSLPDPIVIVNSTNDIILQNKRAEHLFGFEENSTDEYRRSVEINNLLFTSFMSKAGMSRIPKDKSRELNLVDPLDNTDLLFEVLTKSLDDEDKSATVAVLRDVTDLRRAAAELETQIHKVKLAEFDAKRGRDRLNLILANVADPILVTDDLSNIILMNRQAELLFTDKSFSTPGLRTEDTRSQIVRHNDLKFTTFISEFTISADVSRRQRIELRRPDNKGVTLPVEIVSGKILDKRGEPIAIVSVLHDLTKQVENERLYEELKKFSEQLEERVQAATADLAEQNARLQWHSEELGKANRLKSEFLANMSHELRTPINALIGYGSIMLDRIYGDLTDKQAEGLTRMQAASQHLLALINDILDLAKIEAGRMPLHVEEMELHDVIQEINVQIEPMLRTKGLKYTYILPEERVEMVTDRMKVKQILINLLSNAIKFTPSGSVVLDASLAGEGDNKMVHIEVQDTGIGIREEDLASIWEDFRQVDQSRTREFGGTGLGLSITKKLVVALGGYISLSSVYGQGSTFEVSIPVITQGLPVIDSEH